MNKRLFAFALALACILATLGLAACGTDSGAGDAGTAADAAAPGSSTAQAGTDERTPSDEETISQDVDAFFESVLGKENLAGILRGNAEIAELEQMGMDIDALAETLAGVVKVEVESVDVDGDGAVAKVKMSMPDFSTDMDAKMQQALQDALGSQDPSTMGQEELMHVFNQAMQAVLTDPDLPETSEMADIDYVRDGGAWRMKDEDAAAGITEAMAEAIS